jgi:hypothetical protein
MKKLLLSTLTLLIFLNVNAQNTPSWEKKDSVTLTKNQIYNFTKVFIAEYWKSAKEVIQSEDKESGEIFIKGKTKQMANIGLGQHLDFWYVYSVKFMMKDNKFKITVYNVKLDSSPSDWWQSKSEALEPQKNFPGRNKTGLSEKNWITLIESINNEMQLIVDSYDKEIKKNKPTQEDW